MPPKHFLELDFHLPVSFRVCHCLLFSLIDSLTLKQVIDFENHVMCWAQHVLNFTVACVFPKLVLEEFCNLRVFDGWRLLSSTVVRLSTESGLVLLFFILTSTYQHLDNSILLVNLLLGVIHRVWNVRDLIWAEHIRFVPVQSERFTLLTEEALAAILDLCTLLPDKCLMAYLSTLSPSTCTFLLDKLQIVDDVFSMDQLV